MCFTKRSALTNNFHYAVSLSVDPDCRLYSTLEKQSAYKTKAQEYRSWQASEKQHLKPPGFVLITREISIAFLKPACAVFV